jgi:type VI secretion system protein ImpE
MNAEEAIKQGQPREALKLLQDVVRKNPADARQRLFLTQLLAVLGELERAQTQLELVGELDAEAMLFCKMYQGLFEAESFRRKVFAGLASPVIFGDQGRLDRYASPFPPASRQR